jgi:hypothetical protein
MRTLVLTLSACVVLGCGDDAAEPSRACGEQGCSAECEQLRGDNCDILEADCRQRIFDAVVCVRGTPGELPAVRTLTEDEYRAELIAENDADAGVDEPDDVWSTGLALVGLLDPQESAESASTDDLTEDVAGYYDPDTSSITLIDRDHPEDSDESQSLLAHELVHALQDQEMGLIELGDRTGHSYDAYYARRCLTEGEATLYEELALELLRGLPVDTGYLDVSLAWRLKYGRREVAITRSPVSSLWQLTYPVGTRFLADAWLAGGNAEVQGLYWGVPQSTIYWMHGYDAFVERSGQLVRPLACNAARAPEGFELNDVTSFGSFAVYALLAHALVDDGIYPVEAAWQDALAWRQDSLSVFVSAEENVAVSWRILFESDAVAERIADQLRSDASIELKTIARGREVELLAAESADLLDAWDGTDSDACP